MVQQWETRRGQAWKRIKLHLINWSRVQRGDFPCVSSWQLPHPSYSLPAKRSEHSPGLSLCGCRNAGLASHCFLVPYNLVYTKRRQRKQRKDWVTTLLGRRNDEVGEEEDGAALIPPDLRGRGA